MTHKTVDTIKDLSKLTGAHKKWIQPLILAIVAAISLGAYIFASGMTYRVGFPLDDAWIHQTYARNLGEMGQWAFIPGVQSAGSTSPLWTVLLSFGYMLRLPALVWTFMLGGLLYWGIAMAAEMAYRKQFPKDQTCWPWVGLLMLLEWHLAWAAGSGMETLLIAQIVFVVILWSGSPRFPWWAAGLLIGVAVWTRPDGITLIGPAALTAFMLGSDWKQKLNWVVQVGLGLLALLVPYLIFNRMLGGTFWPNTFYAKQTEYAVLQQTSIIQRLAQEFSLPLVGVGVLLLPGVVIYLYKAIQRHDWANLSGCLWVIGYIGLYAWKLPVTYQHGRYIIPAMPIFFYWGVCGYAIYLTEMKPRRGTWVLSRAWGASIALIAVAFWGQGLLAYSRDVAIIESEMVDTARWVAVNTQPTDLIAAHDIGALGYFSDRRLVDLAGLISPEVIPVMRDENQIANLLDRNNVKYLVTFPDWYPLLAARSQAIYVGHQPFAPQEGHSHMTVFRWKIP